MTPFNLEKTAYEFLQSANVKDCIPQVYGYAFRTLHNWGFPFDTEDEEVYYGIVMEWLENAEQLSAENITLHYACALLEGLAKIHEAGVLHYDLYSRNMMVIPGTRRALWIDFSCAHMNEEYALPEEMTAATGVILELVMSFMSYSLKSVIGKRKTSRSTPDGSRISLIHVCQSKIGLYVLFLCAGS